MTQDKHLAQFKKETENEIAAQVKALEAGKWAVIAEKVNAAVDGEDYNKDAVEKRFGVLLAGRKLDDEGQYIGQVAVPAEADTEDAEDAEDGAAEKEMSD
jgi:hypothetical protein